MRVLRLLVVAWLLSLQGHVASAAVVFSGLLNDPGNTALVASDLGAPLFGSDAEVANNVALHPLALATGGVVSFSSSGFAAGGADPYFTLFGGSGPGAVFVASNFVQAFSTGGDFLISLSLAAGDYVIAIGAFANLSFAENLGVGTLGDGFTALGAGNFLGSSFYELTVDSVGVLLPAPPTLLLALLAMPALAGRGLRRQRVTRRVSA